MYFIILNGPDDPVLIVKGKGVKSRDLLRKKYGSGAWRKLKGRARVRLPDGTEHDAEVHWYEAHGIGRRDFKIKTLLD